MSFLLFVAAVVGIAWSGLFVMRGSLLAAIAAYLIATCCMDGNLWALEAGGFTLTIDRLLFAFITLVFAMQWRLGRTDTKRFSGADALLLAFLALVVISTFTHNWRPKPGDPTSTLMHLVDGYMIPVVIFLIAKNVRLTARELSVAYGLLACLGVYLAATAVCEGLGLWSFVFPRFIADPELGIHFGRARGPMLQSARLGMVLIVCATASALLIARAGVWKRPAILAACFVAPLYAAALYFTYTRSVWLGAALVMFIALALSLPRRPRIALFATACLVAVAVVAIKGDKLIAFERESSASVTRESTYMRASFAYVSWQMFLDKPLTGVGFGQFKEMSRPYLSDRSTTLQLEQIRGYIHHNTLLSLLVELGVFGMLMFIVLLICWLVTAVAVWRGRSLPPWMRAQALFFLLASAPYALQLLFREVSYSPIENATMFFLAGTVCSLRATQLAARQSVQPSTSISLACDPGLDVGRLRPSL